MPADLGVAILGISPKDFREAVAEVTEELVETRQEAYDLIIDMLGEVVTPLNKAAFLEQLTARGFARIMAERPEEAKEILQDIRKAAT